jgi:hypothetical protein
VRLDWGEIDRSIFRETGLTPEAVDRMTLAEIAVVCEPVPGPGEVAGMPDHELVEYLNRWQDMAPEEQLWAEDY